jgi:hypothetical protein
MREKLIKFVLFAVFNLVLNSYYLLSQDCPPAYDPDNPELELNFENSPICEASYDFDRYGPGGTINFRKIVDLTNKRVHILIDFDSFQNNSDFAPESALRKLLKREVVYKAMQDLAHEVPSSDYLNYNYNVSVYYLSTCIKPLKALVLLDKNTQIACCSNGMSAPILQRAWDEANGEYRDVYTKWTLVDCGVKCCRIIYNVTFGCKEKTEKCIFFNGEPLIQDLGGCDPYGSTTCTLSGDPESIPCLGNCDDQ